jgi:hypothetical protein
MSELLGYDRDHLIALVGALGRLLDGVTAVRVDRTPGSVGAEPAGAAAVDALDRAERSCAGEWLPRLRSILSCDALGATPQGPDPADLRDLVVLEALPAEWAVLHDPDGAGATDPALGPDDAAALARVLDGRDLDVLLDDPAELAWLLDRLEAIAADPALVRAFVNALHDPASLLDGLTDRLVAALDDADAASSLQSSAAIVGWMVAGSGNWWTLDPLRELVGRVEPLTAALLVRATGITGEELGALTADVVRRWLTPPEGRAWTSTDVPGWTPADLLLPLTVGDPEATGVLRASVAERPELLLDATDDGGLVARVLRSLCDPSTTTSEQAGRVLVAVVDAVRAREPWVHSEMPGGGYDAHALLGSVVAPWLAWFGARAQQWGWTYEEGDDALRWIVTSPQAAADIADGAERLVTTLGQASIIDADGRLDDTALHDVAMTAAQVQAALRAASVDTATQHHAWVGIVDGMISAAASLIPGPGGAAASVVTAVALAPVTDVMSSWGWLPANEDQAGAAAGAAMADGFGVLAVAAVSAVLARLVELGRADDGLLAELAAAGSAPGRGGATCSLRDVTEPLGAFVHSLRGRIDPADQLLVLAVLDAVAGPSATVLACEAR